MNREAQVIPIIFGPSNILTPTIIPALIRVMKKLTQSSPLDLLQSQGETTLVPNFDVEIRRDTRRVSYTLGILPSN